MSPATAGAAILAGGVLSTLPFVPIVKRSWPPRFSIARAKQALRFSGFAWLIQMSQLLNHRLDQMMMIPLVSRRELGLYAVAVTISGVTNMLAPSIGMVLYPKLAAGEAIDVASTLRRGIAAVALSSAACAVLAPVFVPLVFGSRFRAAVPMLLILLLANVPLGGANILASAYTSRPRIALASMSEVAAVVVTVLGLLLVLPAWGGVGAATVSLAAYLVNLCWLLIMARRDFGGQFRSYLVATRRDVSELSARVSGLRPRSPRPKGTSRDAQ
jgi:O-antigen/teichoic acid export membrane protein